MLSRREKLKENPRGDVVLRSAIIEQVEKEFGHNDLKDESLFIAICNALEAKGFKLEINDQIRANGIRLRLANFSPDEQMFA